MVPKVVVMFVVATGGSFNIERYKICYEYMLYDNVDLLERISIFL